MRKIPETAPTWPLLSARRKTQNAIVFVNTAHWPRFRGVRRRAPSSRFGRAICMIRAGSLRSCPHGLARTPGCRPSSPRQGCKQAMSLTATARSLPGTLRQEVVIDGRSTPPTSSTRSRSSSRARADDAEWPGFGRVKDMPSGPNAVKAHRISGARSSKTPAKSRGCSAARRCPPQPEPAHRGRGSYLPLCLFSVTPGNRGDGASLGGLEPPTSWVRCSGERSRPFAPGR